VTDTLSGVAQRAAELRSAFDRAFAAPLRADTKAKQDLLAVRIGPEPCAVRLREVASLLVDRRITRLPTSDAALIGVAGFRGAIVPVYSLLALFGHPSAPAPRWLVIAANAPVALAFDLFEGHLRVPADAILPQQSHAHMRGYAPEFFRAADVVRPILCLTSIIGALSPTAPSAAGS
jgi:chemotaxis signal transduction protein